MSPKSKPRKKRARPSIPVRAARNASDVCLQCGMCCDGTLFAVANLLDDEVDFAASLGLGAHQKADGSFGFHEPCPHFLEGCCSIYRERRPTVCSSYRCALLPAYEAGRATLDDCLDIVDLARMLMRRLEGAIGLPLGAYQAAELRNYVDTHRPQDHPDANQDVLVPLFRLTQLATEYFGWKGAAADPSEAAEVARDQSASIADVAAATPFGAPTS